MKIILIILLFIGGNVVAQPIGLKRGVANTVNSWRIAPLRTWPGRSDVIKFPTYSDTCAGLKEKGNVIFVVDSFYRRLYVRREKEWCEIYRFNILKNEQER